MDGDIAEIFIHSGALRVLPFVSEGYFEIFMDVLEYAASRYKKEIDELKQSDVETSTDSTEDDGEMWL